MEIARLLSHNTFALSVTTLTTMWEKVSFTVKVAESVVKVERTISDTVLNAWLASQLKVILVTSAWKNLFTSNVLCAK